MPTNFQTRVLNIMLVKNLTNGSEDEFTTFVLFHHDSCVTYLAFQKNNMTSMIDKKRNTIEIHFSWENIKKTLVCTVLKNHTRSYITHWGKTIIAAVIDNDGTLRGVSIVLESSPYTDNIRSNRTRNKRNGDLFQIFSRNPWTM